MSPAWTALVAILGLAGCVSADKTHSPHAALACEAYEGTDQLLAYAESHVIILGEMHGTAESPKAIEGVLCTLLNAGIPVRFGIEAEHQQSEALNQALTPPLDRNLIHAAAPAMWNVHDGRSSQAVYNLLAAIAKWKNAGEPIDVFAFDSSWSDIEGASNVPVARDTFMASQVDAAAIDFNGAVVLQTGDFHARKQAFVFDGEDYVPMASMITVRPTLSLNMSFASGEAWVNAAIPDEHGNYQPQVGPMYMHSDPPADYLSETITLTTSSDEAFNFDGTYNTGPITASPPAFPAEDSP